MAKLFKKTAAFILTAAVLLCFAPGVFALPDRITVGETIEYTYDEEFKQWFGIDSDQVSWASRPQHNRFITLAVVEGTECTCFRCQQRKKAGGEAAKNVNGKAVVSNPGLVSITTKMSNNKSEITGRFPGPVYLQLRGICGKDDNVPNKKPLDDGSGGYYSFSFVPFKMIVEKSKAQKDRDRDDFFFYGGGVATIAGLVGLLSTPATGGLSLGLTAAAAGWGVASMGNAAYNKATAPHVPNY